MDVLDNYQHSGPAPRHFKQCIGLHGYYTVSPRSSDQFYIVTYYTKLVTASWTDGNKQFCIKRSHFLPIKQGQTVLRSEAIQYANNSFKKTGI